MPVKRLRGLDTAFLYLETPTNHLHVAWAAVLDTRRAPGAASPRGLSDLIRERLHLLPALRKRLADPHLGYTQPDWIDVDVDPADHCTVHRSADLEAVAADVVARPLDRSRPLWEVHLVEGLGKGRTGMIMKLHHALLDGPSGAELMVQLLDFEPDGPAAPAPRAPLAVDRPPDPQPAGPGGLATRQPGRAACGGRGAQRDGRVAGHAALGPRPPGARRARQLRCPAHAVQPADHRPTGRALHRCRPRRPRQGPTQHGLHGERRGAGDHRRCAPAVPPAPRRAAQLAAAGDGAGVGPRSPVGDGRQPALRPDHHLGHRLQRSPRAVGRDDTRDQRRQAPARGERDGVAGRCPRRRAAAPRPATGAPGRT